MKSINPFTDPGFKKAVLGDVEDVSAEMAEIIDNVPVLSEAAQNIIIDASAISKNKNEQRANEITLSLNNVFTEYNKKYDLDLNIDFSNLSRTLVNVASPEKRRVLELYVSEVFKSIKPILVLHLLSRIALVIDTVLDPNRLLNSSSLTDPDFIIVIEKLMDFVVRLDDIRKDVVISGSELELQKISDERNSGGVDLSDPETRQMVDDFMRLFRQDNK